LPFCLLLSCLACENYKDQYEEEQKRRELLLESLANLEEEERIMKGEYAQTMETISEIDDLLQSIAKRNKTMDELVRKRQLTDDADQQQRIMLQLETLQKANQSSMKEANRLRSKARAYKVENQQIKKMVAKLEHKFEEKEAELTKLRTTIGNMQSSLAEMETQLTMTESELSEAYSDLKVKNSQLTVANKKLESTIEDLKAKNAFIEKDAKAYVVCGTRKELRQNKIIRLLNMKRLTKDYQEKVKEVGAEVSIYDNNEIDCKGDDIIYMLPDRDPNSYTLEGSKLTILDKKAFWTTSKTIVLIKK